MSSPLAIGIINILNSIQQQSARYGFSLMIVFGNIGCVFNCLILLRKTYRQNPCSLYILASSCTNLIFINLVIVSRLLAVGYNYDLTIYSTFYCKFRAYIAFATSLLSRTYIVLACADRYCSSSSKARRRAFSNIKVARYLIPSLALFWLLSSIHVYFYWNIVIGTGNKYTCTTATSIYTVFYAFYNALLSGVLIPTLMIIFGVLTLQNIKQINRRIHNITANISRTINAQQQRRGIADNQLTVMLLVQLLFYVISCLPFPIYLLYNAFTINNQQKSTVQNAIESFISYLTIFLLYLNFCSTFYVYTLSGKSFRKEFKHILMMVVVYFGIIKRSEQQQRSFKLTHGPQRIRPINKTVETITVAPVPPSLMNKIH
ncbi:unnamed protein product [Didymodactylos carnosus]|uniref:G-protein coupled receptors family 1 profile domain-containing protein n=1 Tax=Didymodactylos carnosus TaxID=1234261 RepID=A0A8S2L5N6_9BILA|nr:unnamed protein product [Didymodactylos carnosus]CAF3884271.1 unnamed protein product [Didymodactylos carnosus]